MTIKSYHKILVTCVVCILASGTEIYLLDIPDLPEDSQNWNIKIIHSADEQIITSTALRIALEIDRYYTNTEILGISTFEALESELKKDAWINVYVFHGKPEGLLIGDKLISWRSLAIIIKNSKSEHHVFEVCYSAKINSYIDSSYVYGIEGIIDAEIGFYDALYHVSKIMGSSKNSIAKKSSEKLLNSTIERLGNNLPLVISKLFNPVSPLGIVPKNSGFTGLPGYVIDKLLEKLDQNLSASGTWRNMTVSYSFPIANLGSGDESTGSFPFKLNVTLTVEIKYEILSALPPRGEVNFTVTGSVGLPSQMGKLEDLMDLAGDIDINFEGKVEFKFKIIINTTSLDFITFELTNFVFDVSFRINVVVGIGDAVNKLCGSEGVGALIEAISGGNFYGFTFDIKIKFYFGTKFRYEYSSANEISSFKVCLETGIELILDVAYSVYIGKLGLVLGVGTGIESDAEFTSWGNNFQIILAASIRGELYAKVGIGWFSYRFTILEGGLRTEATFSEKKSEKGAQLAIDKDKDGLSDDFERIRGTNPNLFDTDDDGVGDGNEFFIYLTNPLIKDTDDDGLMDGEEIEFFNSWNATALSDYDGDNYMNILDQDSDDDKLKDGEEKYWWQEKKGRNWNSNPVNPDTDRDYLSDWAEAQLGSNPTSRDSDKEKLVDGEEDVNRDGKIVPPETDPTNNDTDKDGLNDWKELIIHCTNPNVWDTDGDELRDGEEVDRKTNPRIKDTDGDGLDDFTEIHKFGTDPLDPDTDDDYLLDGLEALNNFIANAWIWKDANGNGTKELSEFKYIKRLVSISPIKNDTDSDGVIDSIEVLYGMDPTDTDTDDDSLLDGIEVSNYDGRIDLPFEYEYGTENDEWISVCDPDANGNKIVDGYEIITVDAD
ncbi:MAG: hypothetical protein AB1779_10480, partial [Candidatus Thermoplasmatota archaeon]